MQGRFKRDGSAAAEQEPHGGTDRGSSPQHTQNQAKPPSGDGGDRGARPGAAPGGAEPASTVKPKGSPDTGSRIALRNWRISTRLVSLLTLPVVAATTLGGLRINESMNSMQQLEHMQLLTKMTREATALAEALQNERDHAAGPLTHNGKASDFKVSQPRQVTDQRKAAFLDATQDIGDTTGDEALESIRANVAQIAAQVHIVTEIRKTAYTAKDFNSQTVTAYSRLIDSLLSLSQDMAQATSNPDMIKRTRALAAFSSAKEYASIQRAIIATALPPNSTAVGSMNDNDRLTGLDAKTNEDAALKSFNAIYSSIGGNAEELTAPLESGNSEIDKADKYADRVLRSSTALRGERRSYLDWTDQADTKIQAMNTIEETLLGEMESRARELKQESQQEAIINGVLILVVLGVSLVGAFVVARSMIRSLRRLQDTATRVAQDRLPELVKQLSEADPQDVDTTVESVGVHSRDEIGKVAAAFDDVHREAVRLAAEQALLRGNVNAMFTNLSRRSQGLIQRQLSLISELESREADPDQLSSLFKLDHLATRMRRNGENLLVLAGEEPGRRWTRPVPLVDVLRAAASEVEQYERIELAAVPGTEVAGRVVNDLVHLLAELLENATSFSSPQTKVRVTGHALPDGRVLVEIHDTGIGLSPEDLAAINERLASPPTVDVSVSRRMGLFVVGRLSLRHGIRIQLRPSDSGGTTALVMLPVDVAHGGKKPPAKPGAGAQNGGPGAPAGPGGGRGLTGGPGSAGGPGGGRPGLGGAPSGGRLGAGSAARAALPGRDGAPFQAGPQQGAPQQDPSRQSGAPATAFGADSGRGRPGAQDRDGSRQGGRPDQGGFAAPSGGQNGGGGRARNRGRQGAPAGDDRGRQLPPTGAPRAELPGGPQGTPRQQRPESTSWGGTQQPAPQRSSMDTPRGHEEPESTGRYARPTGAANDRQGNGATEQFARPDYNAPRPGAQDPAATEQFARPDFGAQTRPPAQGQQGHGQGSPRQRGRDAADFGAPRPPAAGLPAPPTPEALPPASGPGDGRTPLYDTLETNWFHQGNGGGQQPPAVPPQPPAVPPQAAPERPATPPRRPSAGPATGQTGQHNVAGQHNANAPTWRTSPNDELVRQAERVRKPAAGGITTSGLPRRVPRANLVPGTAQEQTHQSGPQVSRAPDDVRGRLTNLRRGIQQGRQAGSTGNTGSFNVGPTHQQER
ncbi:nitrate- and nitrite sensing domain-containing protein [Streptomyces sp. NPDC057445]|uniref:sensor histidine kinase n=1 Tax=Streptomyces sp. NPDC057445 TaxID=3346136 RepID=UPI0036C28775